MSLQLDGAVGERLRFGEFELAPVARTLWRRGEAVKLGSRALDILVVLASRPGRILSKDDLTRLVWRGALVDETALRVGISAVRKALGPDGERYIATVLARGYCFILDVEITPANPAPAPPHIEGLNPERLPAQIAPVSMNSDRCEASEVSFVVNISGAGYRFQKPSSRREPVLPPNFEPAAGLSRIIGREDIVRAIAGKLLDRRFVTVVGIGGIGKTTVATAIFDALRSSFSDAARFLGRRPFAELSCVRVLSDRAIR